MAAMLHCISTNGGTDSNIVFIVDETADGEVPQQPRAGLS
jgi:hypothetical protein